jgi:hypothetical protein
MVIKIAFLEISTKIYLKGIFLGIRARPTSISEAGLLNESPRKAQALSVTKFTMIIFMILVTLCCSAIPGHW